MFKPPSFLCREHRFEPWSGNKDHASCMVKQKTQKDKERYFFVHMFIHVKYFLGIFLPRFSDKSDVHFSQNYLDKKQTHKVWVFPHICDYLQTGRAISI